MANLIYDKQGQLREEFQQKKESLYFGRVAALAANATLVFDYSGGTDQLSPIIENGFTSSGVNITLTHPARLLEVQVSATFEGDGIPLDDSFLFEITPQYTLPGDTIKAWTVGDLPPVYTVATISQVYTMSNALVGSADQPLSFYGMTHKGPVPEGTVFRFSVTNSNLVGLPDLQNLNIQIKLILWK